MSEASFICFWIAGITGCRLVEEWVCFTNGIFATPWNDNLLVHPSLIDWMHRSPSSTQNPKTNRRQIRPFWLLYSRVFLLYIFVLILLQKADSLFPVRMQRDFNKYDKKCFWNKSPTPALSDPSIANTAWLKSPFRLCSLFPMINRHQRQSCRAAGHGTSMGQTGYC